jgi:hypothetical protein
MKKKPTTVGEKIFWAYANTSIADMALSRGDKKFNTLHYMIRAKFYKGLLEGSMSPRSMIKDHKVKLKLPMECVYCGCNKMLSLDHVIPRNRGGADVGDNVVWACRSCNSSKSDLDLFNWWFSKKTGFPPVFLIRVYLKQAIDYFSKNERLAENWIHVTNTPFDLASVPEDFPEPNCLIFTFHHARLQKENEQA